MATEGASPARSTKRKLIEVALPLEAINREAAREKSIRHGHPSTLHLWWARRPLAAARAVLFAQLVDDPSSHPDRFPTEESQRRERERLHDIINELVVWENVRDKKLLERAHQEILKSTDGDPPAILDPFCGGGTIPLEAQRLGLEAHASDLNPVAVLITKALIEIPPRFRDRPPVYPGLAACEIRQWEGAEGLAADVRAYGAWMRDEAEKRIGHMYPKAKLSDGRSATVIAWMWARTVTCANPACGAEVPLVSSLWLCKKPDRKTWLKPVVEKGGVDFLVQEGGIPPATNKVGQGARFVCWVCRSALTTDTVHAQLDVANPPPARLLAVVAAGRGRRVYLLPSAADRAALMTSREQAVELRTSDTYLSQKCRGTFGGNAQGRRYGFFTFADYFTDRQLLALTTFSDLVGEARERVVRDARATGISQGERLERGDAGASAYADAVAIYLAMALSKMADRGSTIVTWFLGRESTRNTFARQAIPMSWDFVEPNQFADGTGSWHGALEWTAEALDGAVAMGTCGSVVQGSASAEICADGLISTDPPYYDNIGYSDLSDFFYVWLRRTLHTVMPNLFGTVLVPKSEELVANPYRHGGREGARRFFEEGFREVFVRARIRASDNAPVTVYYAFKQSQADQSASMSSGWETLLDGMIRSGWEITSTWPLRSELGNRMVASGTNALASSIVLSLRPRPGDARLTDRREFMAALRSELPDALRRLQEGAIAPVDLPQAAIGPGMAVFSRYSSVIEDDGSPMAVRAALARINEILDLVLAEQEGDFDTTTRFAIAWYRQHGYGTGKFGDADNIARARNTSVEALDRDGVLTSRAGRVGLLRPENVRPSYAVLTEANVSAWEVLHHLTRAMNTGGIAAAGVVMASATSRLDNPMDADLIKELAFLLFSIAEKNGWAKDALAFNDLVTSWPEILEAAREGADEDAQTSLSFEGAE